MLIFAIFKAPNGLPAAFFLRRYLSASMSSGRECCVIFYPSFSYDFGPFAASTILSCISSSGIGVFLDCFLVSLPDIYAKTKKARRDVPDVQRLSQKGKLQLTSVL